MNWRSLLKDKRFLAAAAVVGVVGLVVLLRRKGDSPGDEQTEDGSGTAVQGRFDTSATDMASWISDYSSSILDAIRANRQGGSLTPADQPVPSENRRMPEPAPPPPPPLSPGGTASYRESAPVRVPWQN